MKNKFAFESEKIINVFSKINKKFASAALLTVMTAIVAVNAALVLKAFISYNYLADEIGKSAAAGSEYSSEGIFVGRKGGIFFPYEAGVLAIGPDEYTYSWLVEYYKQIK